MKPITLLRGTLVALGIFNLVYQSMTRKTGSGVLAPSRTPPLPAVVGVVALGSGLALLYVGASSLIAARSAVIRS